tara:strand:- start:27 stop:728 length:702 start_codon:yes stop_codon:yes gene_type:complete
MNFIHKIAERKTDALVKKQFTRYSRGDYEKRALIEIRIGKKNSTIKTGFEFAGELAYELSKSVEGEVQVTGGIITTRKLEDELPVPIASMTQFAGVKKYLLDCSMTKEVIQELYNTFPTTLIFLSFETKEGKIKTKVKNPPKPGKGKKKEAKADFCLFKTTNMETVKDFAFDVPEGFSKAVIAHTFSITDLEIPEDCKNDFARARKEAIRKGSIVRTMIVDEKEIVKEYPFEA